MASITATQAIQDALGILNVLQLGETLTSPGVDANIGTDALRRLNLMIEQWGHQQLTIPAVQRFVGTLLSGKGSSTNPYTIGSGGDLNTPRPPNQQSVVGAGLILSISSPTVEIPRGVMTNDGWERTRIKDLTSTLFTNVYYRPDFASNLGSIFLWPVPTDLTNQLVLYIRAALTQFADLTTAYIVPDGYEDALQYNLAERLAGPYGRTFTATIGGVNAAVATLAVIKRSNTQLSDVDNDFSRIGMRRGPGAYNIQTGER